MSPKAKTITTIPFDISQEAHRGNPDEIHSRIRDAINTAIKEINIGHSIVDTEMIGVDRNDIPIMEYYLLNGKLVEFPEKECMKAILEFLSDIFKNGYVDEDERYYIAPINLSDFKKHRKYDIDIVFISEREHEMYMIEIAKYESVFQKILTMIRNKSYNTKNRKRSNDLFACANDLERMFHIYQIWNLYSYTVFIQDTFKWDRKQVFKYTKTLSDEEMSILFYE
tara:strand:- start:3883 stop:4557 length:675 start_codon:yes stop_codon:yes gene_type:complete